MQPFIHIFKTNINQEEDLPKIASLLNVESISQWNIDQSDIDCVLRVVTCSLTIDDIILILANGGYECSELNN